MNLGHIVYYRFKCSGLDINVSLQGRSNRDQSLVELVQHLKRSYLPLDRKWMILFPEGGFLRKRKAVSQEYARKNNLAVLENVTLPRVGALHAIISTVGAQGVANNNSLLNIGKLHCFGLAFLMSFLRWMFRMMDICNFTCMSRHDRLQLQFN